VVVLGVFFSNRRYCVGSPSSECVNRYLEKRISNTPCAENQIVGYRSRVLANRMRLNPGPDGTSEGTITEKYGLQI